MWSGGSGATFSSTPERVGRDGALRLRFERRTAGTVLTACRSTVPLQVLAPLALPDSAAVVSILNPTGGLVGGGRLLIEVEAGPGAHACLTTPSATKVYRTAGEPAHQEVTLRLGPGAVIEYVPDHTIPFAGADFRQSLRAEVGAGARLLVVDAFAAGRVARGEAWRFARLESALQVATRAGRSCAIASCYGSRWPGTQSGSRKARHTSRPWEPSATSPGRPCPTMWPPSSRPARGSRRPAARSRDAVSSSDASPRVPPPWATPSSIFGPCGVAGRSATRPSPSGSSSSRLALFRPKRAPLEDTPRRLDRPVTLGGPRHSCRTRVVHPIRE